MRLVGQGVDDFVGAGVVEALAGFELDGAGVGLEVVYVLAQVGVLVGQALDLGGEGFVFGALVLPVGEAVASVDYVPGEKDGEDYREGRADTAAAGGVGCFGSGEQRLLRRGLSRVLARILRLLGHWMLYCQFCKRHGLLWLSAGRAGGL